MTVTAIATPDPDEPTEGTAEFEPLWERRMQALSLRNGGMTFAQIAEFQKISPGQARRDVAWAKRHVAGEDIEDIIATQRSVIIDMRRANYQSMLQGDKDASATILKGLDHEAKLLGLYAPVRVQTGPSHVEFSERAAELIKAVSPDTLKELIRGTRTVAEQRRDADAETAAPDADDDAQPIDVEAVELSPFGPAAHASRQAASPVRPVEAEPGDAPEPASEPDDDDWSNIG